MRPLRDLVGQRVRWQGVLDYWDQNRACFRCVELLPYCAEGGSVRKIDHLWCWFPAQEAAEKLRDRGWDVHRLAPTCGVATVIAYTRKNRSQDFGIKLVGTLDQSSLEHDLFDPYLSSESAVDDVNFCWQAFCDEQFFFPLDIPWSAAKSRLEDWRDRVTRNYEENQRRLSAQVHHPLTRDPKIPGRKVGRAIGFAN